MIDRAVFAMTFLEDFQYNLECLPSVLQRQYSIMRNLDESLQTLQKQNEERCENEIEGIKRGIQSGNITPNASLIRFSDEALDEQKHCIRISDEKLSIAMNAYDVVDHHIQQLDEYLRKFDHDIYRAVAGAIQPTHDDSKSGRGPGSRRGRKKSSLPGAMSSVPVVVESSGMELDLPVDPNEPTYCFCNQVSYGEMVACDNPDCKIEWFHFGCVGLKEQPKGKWFCANCVGMVKRRRGK